MAPLFRGWHRRKPKTPAAAAQPARPAPKPKTRRVANPEYYGDAKAKATRALRRMPPEKAAHFWRAFEWSQDVPMEHERPNVANMLYHGRGEEPALVARALAESGEHAETAARLLWANAGITPQDILGHTRIPGAVEFLGTYPEAHQLIKQHGETGLRAAHRAIEWYEANRPGEEEEKRGSFIDLARFRGDAVRRVAEQGLDAL